MNTKQAIILINAALKKIAELRKGNPHSPDHVAFVQTTELDLIRIFGPDSIITKNFSAIDYSAIGQFFSTRLILKIRSPSVDTKPIWMVLIAQKIFLSLPKSNY